LECGEVERGLVGAVAVLGTEVHEVPDLIERFAEWPCVVLEGGFECASPLRLGLGCVGFGGPLVEVIDVGVEPGPYRGGRRPGCAPGRRPW
jgi:hypothetical protein